MFSCFPGRQIGWTAASALAISIQASAACAEPAGEILFNLPEQSLEQSLREVSTRTGTSVVAPADLVAGRDAPALNGRHTALSAVEKLLSGTGLTLRRVDDALVITSAAATREAAPDIGGVLPPDGQNIVVTGSNLRGAEPTSPVIRLTREDIDRSGATSVEQLMRTVPQNTQGGINKENFGLSVPGQDVTEHGAGLNLRGLGQRATLVLVDGRRLAPSGSGSFVDVSLIPLSAVGRVEILTDGASAIYGSDAVGGVVNFILRDRYDGVETSLQAGTTTRGGGDQLQASIAAGEDWQGGSGLLAYEYRREEEVRAADRSFTINLRPATFLLPSERKHSLLGRLEQELTPDLVAGVTGTYARRTSDRTVFQSVSPLPVDVDSRAQSLSFAGDLGYSTSGGWLVRLGVDYGLYESEQQQTQPGGIPLVNSRDVRNAILELGLRADGPILSLPAGPVRLAVGGLTRWEETADVFQSSAIARTERGADRRVHSLFGELLVPLFSPANRMPGFERLELSLAARYDDYQATGSTADPKVGLLWSPLGGLLLRGSYSTSFRAPLLTETTGAYNAIFVPARLLYANPAQAPAGAIGLILQGSDPEVGPETSRTWTVGAELAPRFLPALRLTANYYSIRFSDRIARPTSRLNVVGNPAFAPIVDLAPTLAGVTQLVQNAQVILDGTGPGGGNGGATPADVDLVLDTRSTNSAFTITRGFDLGLRYAFSLGAHAFWADANVNHILAFEDRLTASSPEVNALDRVYGPLDWRVRAGLGWNHRGWAASLFLNHADGYDDDRTAAVRRVAAHSTLDLSLSHQFGASSPRWARGSRIGLFVENLLDTKPPFVGPDPGSSRGFGYDPVNATARGRFVALQLRRTW